jgi:hypothetical protein
MLTLQAACMPKKTTCAHARGERGGRMRAPALLPLLLHTSKRTHRCAALPCWCTPLCCHTHAHHRQTHDTLTALLHNNLNTLTPVLCCQYAHWPLCCHYHGPIQTHSPLCFVATMVHISSIRSLNRCTSSLVRKPCRHTCSRHRQRQHRRCLKSAPDGMAAPRLAARWADYA